MDSSTSTKQPDRVEIQAAARSAHRWLVATTLGLLGCALALVLLGLLDWPSPEPIPFLAGESTVRDGSLVLIGSAALALVAVALILGLVGFSERLGDRRGKRQDWWLAAAFSAFALATLMAGWLQVGSTLRAYRVVRMEEQVAVARTKAAQIDDWTTERLIDLRFVVETLRSFPIFDPAAKPEVAALAELVLAQFLSAYPERVAVGVFRPDGRPIIVQGRFDPLLADALRADIEETAKRNKPYIGVVNPGGAHETGLSLAFMAPLAGPNRTGTDRLVVASVVDPTVALLKRFGEWPAAGKGTLTLGFRSGDELVQIVDAGKQMGSAVLSVRAAIPEERLTRVLADTRGEASWRGIGQGGQQTLTAAYAVKDMPWTVIARTDLKEAMAPISRQIWALWVATAVVIAFGGLLMLTVRSQMKLSRLLAHV